MKLESLYQIFTQHPIVTTDTRNCPENSIFFALKGANFNGNEYAKKAIQSGCSYAIVDESDFADESNNILLVDDVLKTLQDLAHYHRSKFSIPVIGITGTNGKTTSKELVTAVLSKEFEVLSTQGNLNNHIGVPLTLLRMNKSHEIAVIEMGASHVGEIKILSEIADPTFGIITNIGHAHIEGFGSYENIIKTKSELYDYIRTRKDGKVFIDANNDLLMKLAEGLTMIQYGEGEDFFVRGKVVDNDPYMSFVWQFSKNDHLVHTHLIGEYNLTNVLAAVSVGKYFGVKKAKINEAISEYIPTNNRSQLKKTDRNMLVIDAYNANPTSMSAALDNFKKLTLPNKVVILGDMKELGVDAEIEHQAIADLLTSGEIENAYLIGEHFSKTNTSHLCYQTLNEFLDYLKKNPLKDKNILIKGSRSIQLEKCIDLL